MFATLLGPLPRPTLPDEATPDELLIAVVRAQEAAGLEPITDGGFGVGETLVDRWRATAALTERPVKATALGPYSAARTTSASGDLDHAAMSTAAISAAAMSTAAMSAADRIRMDLLALAAAGCPFIEIHEPAAAEIGTDSRERERFRGAHQRMLAGVSGTHLSLAVTGGNADAAGVEILLAAPYASLAVDLIDGPDNWRLVAGAPGDRGIICGALSVERDADDRLEVLLWAAAYAASTGGRGPARVGLATASSLAGLPWEVAERKLSILGEAVRLAELPPDERHRLFDPRAVDIRSAALGRVEPRPRPTRSRRPER
ncbi:MAG TPA: hypothetical protein VFW02_03255 [Candidatus Limnocylindrales bacterium]|nr:hypothetical protein [Candidatus Limnocylindrales bacterium]